MFSYLRRLKLDADKKRSALVEDFPLSDFLQKSKYKVEKFPFPYVVADNFFKEEINKNIIAHFNGVLNKGTAEQNDPTRFHPFLDLKGEFQYDGYVYPLRPEADTAVSIFFSVAWNLFISKLFNEHTGWSTSTAYHHHNIGDHTGFVHNDFAKKTFSKGDRLTNNVVFRECGGESALTKNYENIYSERRAISVIYYIGNPLFKQGDGGETGFYRSKIESPCKLVAPINNRLLAFQISTKSFHAFQENFTPRSSVIQFFHVPIDSEENNQ